MTPVSERGQRVALGMSGGVDSSVSAALLLYAGYQVVGVTCRFISGDSGDQMIDDAAGVCAKLGIPHIVHECLGDFEREIVTPFVSGYASGLTPSPCIVCNARCKIPALLKVAESEGCERIATGHYARIAQLLDTKRHIVKTALDINKDQSYMLALLSQSQLGRLVLPLGGMTKTDVRMRAAEMGLAVAEKPESQDVCFIEGDYRDFLDERGVEKRPGDIVDRSGAVLGRHEGLSRFTVGQRKGIGVAAADPYYVVEKRPKTNELVVGSADESLISSVRVRRPNWQECEKIDESRVATVKLRYRSRAVPCIIEPEGPDCARIVFRSSQPTTASGQYAVLYDGATVLGGGMIEEVVRA